MLSSKDAPTAVRARTTVATFAITACAVATFAVALIMLAPPARASAAELGAVTSVTWGQPKNVIDRELAMLKEANVRWIRANVNWRYLEPNQKGAIDQSMLDRGDYVVERAGQLGIQVLMPIADGTPYWASSDPAKYQDGSGKHWNQMYPPANPDDYADIVRFVVARYAPRGVHAYEMWNEPNNSTYWGGPIDPARYVPMLRQGYRSAKAADPGSTVLLGGLCLNDYGYLKGVYDAGGGPYFDAVSVHPYTGNVDPTSSFKQPGSDRLSYWAFPALAEIKREMDAHGDSHKQVWATEFGWSTGTDGVSEQTQAEYLTKALRYSERYPWLHSLFWYMARNDPFMGDSKDYMAQYGLMTIGFRQKPSYYALKSYVPGSGWPDPQPTPEPALTLPLPRPTVTRSVKKPKRSKRRVKGSVPRKAGPIPNVQLEFQRLSKRGSWRTVHSSMLRVREARYELPLEGKLSRRGSWRVRALPAQASSAAADRPNLAASSYREFRIR